MLELHVESRKHNFGFKSRAELVMTSSSPSAHMLVSSVSQRLFRLLEVAEDHGHAHIISWDESGESFTIHKQTEFIGEVLPRCV